MNSTADSNPAENDHPPSELNSVSPASSYSAPISLADWVQQATPEELQKLEALIQPAKPVGLVVTTLGEVAEWFGLQLQTVKQWRVGPNGCPGGDGVYNLQEIARWRVQQGKSGNGSTSAKQELEQESLVLTNARLSLKLRKEAGELVSRDAAKSAIRQMFAKLKSQLETLTEVLAPLVPSEVRVDFRRDCRERIVVFLQSLANFRFDREVAPTENGDESEDHSPELGKMVEK